MLRSTYKACFFLYHALSCIINTVTHNPLIVYFYLDLNLNYKPV